MKEAQKHAFFIWLLNIKGSLFKLVKDSKAIIPFPKAFIYLAEI